MKFENFIFSRNEVSLKLTFGCLISNYYYKIANVILSIQRKVLNTESN